jgi:hypothetical protein
MPGALLITDSGRDRENEAVTIPFNQRFFAIVANMG